MPDVSGMDFHDWLKERAPGVAANIVFLSGGVFTERGTSFVFDVPNLRLEKPIDTSRLRAVVNERVEEQPEPGQERAGRTTNSPPKRHHDDSLARGVDDIFDSPTAHDREERRRRD